MKLVVPIWFNTYFSLMFLFDMCKESRIREVPLAAGTPEFPFCFLFGLHCLFVIDRAIFFRHIKI